MKLFIDFETFYDSKSGYDLKSLSTLEYCRDPRFKIFGVGIATDDSDGIAWLPNLTGCTWPQATVVAHNVKFDGFILRNNLGLKPRSYIDTKGMARAVLGNRVPDYSLKTLAKYFGLPEKGQLKTDGLSELMAEQEKELVEYCKHDVWLCREIYNRLAPEFPENQYPIMDWTVRTFVEPKLILDVPLLEKTNEQEKIRREKAISITGFKKDVFASNQKFARFIEGQGFHVPTKRSPRTGKQIPALSVSDPAFIEFEQTADKSLKKILEARKAAKSTLLETRTEKLAKIGKTGPWSFDVQFSGAVQTHRFSGGSGAGGNPQNFTRGSALRRSVESPAGMLLVVADFSSIEMRLVSYLAKSTGLTSLIEQEKDVYCDFASAFFGRTITKADEEERRFGKIAILGLGYGMGPVKFANTVLVQTGKAITKEQAQKAVRLYRARYWQIPALWERLQQSIPIMTKTAQTLLTGLPVHMAHECIVLPSGLKLQYPNLRQKGKEWVYDTWETKEKPTETKLYGGKLLENITQALAGELCKEVLRDFSDTCVGQVHDELHLLVPEDSAHEAAQALRAAMTAAPQWLPELKLDAEVGVGKTWLEAK